MSRRKSRGKKKLGGYILPVAMVLFVLVLGFNIIRLYNKNQSYEAKEEALEEQLKEQEDRSEDLSAFEEFTKTVEYVEQVAREKLGLVFDNEIIFKSDENQ